MLAGFLKSISRYSGRKLSQSRPSRRRIGVESLRLEPLETRHLLALVWSPGVDLPQPRVDSAAALGADETVYLFGGNTTDVNVLAAGSIDWEVSEPIDKERVGLGAGALADGRIFLFGGQNGGQSIEETYLYDPINGDPQDGAVMSTTRAQGAYTFDSSTGLIFALGGVDEEGVLLSSAEAYDSSSDSWTTLSNLPGGRADFAAAADGAGHVFTFGGRRAGYGSGDVSQDVYRYNIASDAWQAMASMPAALRDVSAVAGPNNGLIYVIGGRSATGVVASVYAYNYISNTWTVETSLPSAVADAAAVLDSEGHVLLLGGRNALGQALSVVVVTQDLDAEDSAPTFVSVPPSTATSTVTYSYQVFAAGNPQPAFELVAAPSGMTINATGLITWTPNESHVGSQPVNIRAFNLAGSVNQSFSIAVDSAFPVITSTPVMTAATGVSYVYDVNATGAPAPSYSLTASPAGMAINAGTGVIAWTPSVSQVGTYAVTVVAQNTHGTNGQSYSVNVADHTAPTAPTTLTVTGSAPTSVSLLWNAATDNVGVAKYQVYQQYHYGWRNSQTGYRLVVDNVAGTSATVAGLTPNTNYTFAVRAVDAAGNMSGNSNLLTTRTYVAPYFYTLNAPQATANHAYTFQLGTVSNPVPTYSLVSGPTGMTVDPSTGTVSWMPEVSDIGVVAATFRATNVVGSTDLMVNITVRADVPVLTARINNGTGPQYGLSGQPMTIEILDSSLTPSTFSIVSGPANMTIDPVTGVASWTPALTDAGSTSVVVRATNSAGSTDRTVNFYTYFTSQPTGLTVTNPGAYTPNLTWTAPASTAGIAGYKVTASYKTGVGWRAVTHTQTFDSPGTGTSIDLTGLVVGKTYTIRVNAYDAAGHVSLTSANFSYLYAPAISNLGWVINGTEPVVANQAMTIQLTDYNPSPRIYSIVSGPAGMTIDPTSGLVSWTPSASDIGNVTATFRAVNSVGPRDVVVNFPVYFSGAPSNVGATRSGTTASVVWTAPTDNAAPIAGYQVRIEWSINGHTYSRIDSVTSTSHSFGLLGGPVVYRVSVAAVDSLGRVGVYSPLVTVPLAPPITEFD